VRRYLGREFRQLNTASTMPDQAQVIGTDDGPGHGVAHRGYQEALRIPGSAQIASRTARGSTRNANVTTKPLLIYGWYGRSAGRRHQAGSGCGAPATKNRRSEFRHPRAVSVHPERTHRPTIVTELIGVWPVGGTEHAPVRKHPPQLRRGGRTASPSSRTGIETRPSPTIAGGRPGTDRPARLKGAEAGGPPRSTASDVLVIEPTGPSGPS